MSSTRVYVGNLGTSGEKGELEREFAHYGRLRDVWVARNPPGFAFIEFEHARDAEEAVRELDGATLCGVKGCKVELSHGKGRGRGGGRGSSRGGGGGRRGGFRDNYGSRDRYDDNYSSDRGRYTSRRSSPPPPRRRSRSPVRRTRSPPPRAPRRSRSRSPPPRY